MGTSSNRNEEHYAIALVGLRTPWPRSDGGWFSMLDYQVPLKAERGDAGIGKVDLIGVTNRGRLMIVELKVTPRSGRGDAPPRALIEGLRYAAIVQANNRAIAQEARDRFGVTVTGKPPLVQILAPLEWWHDWLEPDDNTRKVAGHWEAAFARLTRNVEANLDVTVECMALGDARLTLGLNGRKPQLDRAPTFHPVRPGEHPAVCNALPLPQSRGGNHG